MVIYKWNFDLIIICFDNFPTLSTIQFLQAPSFKISPRCQIFLEIFSANLYRIPVLLKNGVTASDDEVTEMESDLDSDVSDVHDEFDNSDHPVVKTVKECEEEGLRLSGKFGKYNSIFRNFHFFKEISIF